MSNFANDPAFPRCHAELLSPFNLHKIQPYQHRIFIFCSRKFDNQKILKRTEPDLNPEMKTNDYTVHFPRSNPETPIKDYKVSGPVLPDSIRYQ
jgi:hypothetical protein